MILTRHLALDVSKTNWGLQISRRVYEINAMRNIPRGKKWQVAFEIRAYLDLESVFHGSHSWAIQKYNFLLVWERADFESYKGEIVFRMFMRSRYLFTFPLWSITSRRCLLCGCIFSARLPSGTTAFFGIVRSCFFHLISRYLYPMLTSHLNKKKMWVEFWRLTKILSKFSNLF